ncbi:MAG: glycerol-3-phosphate dehydrogenase/oxidase [Planctomycetota bacterium]
MQRDIDQVRDQTFDLVVIGGGIFGACAACDAAQRGLSVALIERGDFGGATSANSLKMIHGGIRYVQHLDIARVRHSAAERRTFLRVAPHLVHPLPIVIPTYGHGMKGMGVLRIGMGLFDLMTVDANRGIADRSRRIPWCKTLCRPRTLDMYPGLEEDGLTGAALFSDAQMYNPCRLVLAFLQKGIEAGAVAVNHAEVTSFLRDGRKVTGVAVRDTLTDEDFPVNAKMVLNAAGPYAERLLADASVGVTLRQKITYSRDTAFVVKRKLTHPSHAVALQGTTSDPDAKLGRGERHMFVAPWRDDYTLLGVWHVVYNGDPAAFTVTDEELKIYLDEMNRIYPAWGLKLEDVALCNAGLVPFGDNPEGASHAAGQNLRYGHRSHLIDHAKDHGLDNLVTLIGVRYTTGRYEAQHALDLIERRLGRGPTPCRTAATPVAGGDIADVERFVADVTRREAGRLSPAVCRALVRNYGTAIEAVLAAADADRGLLRTLGDSTTIAAEVVHAVRHEMAVTLADVVLRRTDLATGGYPGEAVLGEVVELMAAAGGALADPAAQIAEVASRFPVWAVGGG